MNHAPDGPGRTTPTVVVVGAGITGLTAAWRLRRANRHLHVVVLEQAPRYGGALLARPLDPDVVGGGTGPVLVDVGAEALLARRPEAVELVQEVGLGDDLLHPVTSRAAIYSRGALHPIPAGTVMGVPGDPGSLRGLLTDDEVARVAAEPAMPAPPVQGDVDVASWVAGRVGQAVVDRLVEPLLGGVYAGHASRLSLHATLPVLWPAAVHGASVLDTVRRHAASPAVSAGDTDTAQAAPVFAGIRGGVTRLVHTLVERLLADGVEVRTQACVQGLERKGSGWVLALGPAGRGEVLAADAVVLALPAARAARLLAHAAPEACAELSGIASASMAVGTYVVPASVLDGLDLSGFLVPPVEDRLVKAVTFSTRKWAWLADLTPGKAVLRASFGRAGEEATLQRADHDLLAAGAADVAQMLLRAVPVHAAQLTRWGGALPQYEVGHVERVARIRALVGDQPGLAVAGASYDGVGVPACIASAGAAAGVVLERLG